MTPFAENIPRMQARQAAVFGPPGGTVAYTTMDGTWTLPALRATVGSTNFPIADVSGNVTSYQSRDYLVLASDLVDADGSPMTPSRGDRITEGGRTYTVALDDPSQNPWTFSDTTRQVYRIHTKQTA